MKKDIEFPQIENVFVTIAKNEEKDMWQVYLLNRHQEQLDTVMVTSKGYGKKGGKEQKTSVLRHMIPQIEPGEYALIEPIDQQVFHLNNEYWVSFFIKGQLYDKKYIFVPETIIQDNLSFIKELGMQGVLHQ
ncbi:hypothetical protein [Marinoscillum furvescens]|uniref:Phenylalanyl-tRNA synthetase subunit alpha n=1 Tax=Marinoscillum furvescens DSM 4134 TaxID=1122208 RepID=A0A3D9L666_MARFU|nr:hypothetical protein [Marinoscillum furvescens]REE01594.1 hypothetical protein C7460_103110 [Marinoscillum furvescens DSM 4134]